jgi:hypothetical protein
LTSSTSGKRCTTPFTVLTTCNRCAVYRSDLREIPNTQEVFAHPTTDQSLIFDLLEYQNVPDNEAAQYVNMLCFIVLHQNIRPNAQCIDGQGGLVVVLRHLHYMRAGSTSSK